MRDLDEGTLVAYVDGELDPETSREVEELLADDPQSQALVSDLRESSALLRAAFNRVLHEPPPDRLVEAVRRHAPGAGSGGGDRWRGSPRVSFGPWRAAYALAASFAALVVGLGGGYFFAAHGGAESFTQAEKAGLVFQMEVDRTRTRVLENELSGTTVQWEDSETGNAVSVTPVRTYRDQTGRYCREYREERIFDRAVETRHGLSCRTPDGRWVPLRVIIRRDVQST